MKNMRKKIYFIVIFILLLIGGTYAYFNFTFIGDDSYELVNNIYITFQNGSSINISNGFPESDESARNHETESVTLNSKNIDVADNEMVFYISGNNEDSNFRSQLRKDGVGYNLLINPKGSSHLDIDTEDDSQRYNISYTINTDCYFVIEKTSALNYNLYVTTDLNNLGTAYSVVLPSDANIEKYMFLNRIVSRKK